MITIDDITGSCLEVRFVKEKSEKWQTLSSEIKMIFDGKFLNKCILADRKSLKMYIGTGEKLDRHGVKEVCAYATKEIKDKELFSIGIHVSAFVKTFGVSIIREVVEGLVLGLYDPAKKLDIDKYNILIRGIPDEAYIRKEINNTLNLVKGTIFVRDMVNMPGNHLRPLDLSKMISELLEDTNVTVEQIVSSQIKAMGMDGLSMIGLSSEYPPCLLVIRYMGDPNNEEITGFIGKGVTCDTGGYCLKSSESMKGIKGDMAGGATVAASIYALSKNNVKTNVVGIIPMCENRISKGSLLPGDVITMYSGKTVEIMSTDAEGRLILADGVSYAIKNENVTRVLDIATLTGAVVGTLGFGTAGVLVDNKEFYEEFKRGYRISNEKYWRFPFEKEHEKLIESTHADIKNHGGSYAGVITAGLFIRAFAESKPWIHVDIAGTAWVDTPVYEYQSKGATGSGVSTLYYLLQKEDV